jgi:hypothetical protein
VGVEGGDLGMTDSQGELMRKLRQWRTSALVLLGLLVLVTLVSVSPAALLLLAHWRIDWNQLAIVGQAYGGVSAILSALALCGVALSLLQQSRQARADRVIAIRERHFELVKLDLERPDLIEVSDMPDDHEERQVWLRSNLWMTHWLMRWQLGLLGEADLRRTAFRLFGDPRSQAWWEAFGHQWAADGSRE